MSAPQAVSAVAAPDWVTAVADGEIDRRILRDVGNRYLGLAMKTHAWKLRNYVGRATADIPSLDGGVATGEDIQHEKTILQTWGSLSQRALADLMRAHSLRWTRCDIAVTVLYDQPLPPIILWHEAYNKDEVKVSFITGNDGGGGTMYVGSRSSEQFGRVYDKGAQLGTCPGGLYWRWEVEFKRDSGANVVDELLSRTSPQSRAEWIEDAVHEWFASRNIPAPERGRVPLQYPMIRYGSRVTTDQTTIKWLSQQVQPAVRRLEKAGRLKEALDALGVDAGCLMPEAESLYDQSDQQLAMLDLMQLP